MSKTLLCLVITLCSLLARAQQSKADFEKGLSLMEKQGQIRREGNKIIFLNQRPGDTAFMREMYNKMLEKVDQSKNPYTIAFEIGPQYLPKNSKLPATPAAKPTTASATVIHPATTPATTIPIKSAPSAKPDTSKPLVYKPVLPQANTTFRLFHYLKNGDFEQGYYNSMPGWRIDGRAFNRRQGNDVYTWKHFNVVSTADVGGDYWTDVKFHIGYKHQHWVTSRTDNILGNANDGGGATGTLTSDPFKLYPDQNFISFLVSGGMDMNNLKVEFLQCNIGPTLTGNVRSLTQTQPALPGVHQSSVGTIIDTTYTPVRGISPKTGHNSHIFRREYWDVHGLDTSKLYVIRVTDNSTNMDWGIINVDDFRMLKYNPTANREADDSLRVQLITIKDMVSNLDRQIVVDQYVPIYGAVDLHTHLMSYLGMGKKLLYGAPDIGSIIPAGTYFCNPSDYRATSVDQCLGNCNSAHGGWGTDNTCGNYIRAAVLNYAFDGDYEKRVSFDRNPHGDHPHDGYPNFLYWPHFSSVSHQQMYVDWIRRAYQGGLRVMVTLTVNSELLGGVVSGDGPLDDKADADLQLDEIAAFVRRHSDFMQLALKPEDIRSIVRSNKMAVVIGMEVDNIGNFNYANVTASEAAVSAEIQRLYYQKNVRYIFPVHLVNNKFGGSAVYSLLFNLSNKYTTSRPLPWGTPIPPGHMFNVEAASDARIKYTLSLTNGTPTDGAMNAAIFGMGGFLAGVGEMPFPPAFNADFTSGSFCPVPKLGCIQQFKIIQSLLTVSSDWDVYNNIPGGQQNQLGLTDLGKFAIRQMMKLGMIVDVDHMSDHAVRDALTIANQYNYPVSSGHNGLRDGFFENAEHKVSENQRTNDQLQNIRRLGGIFGLGIGESTAGQYLTNFRLAMSSTKMNGGAIMMGSDINGCVTMPKPRHGPGRGAERDRYRGGVYTYWAKEVDYAAPGQPTFSTTTGYRMRKYSFGNKSWDYNTDGVAHIGLFPDYFQDLKNLGMTLDERQVFFNAADYFVSMWDKCDKNKVNVR